MAQYCNCDHCLNRAAIREARKVIRETYKEKRERHGVKNHFNDDAFWDSLSIINAEEKGAIRAFKIVKQLLIIDQ